MSKKGAKVWQSVASLRSSRHVHTEMTKDRASVIMKSPQLVTEVTEATGHILSLTLSCRLESSNCLANIPARQGLYDWNSCCVPVRPSLFYETVGVFQGDKVCLAETILCVPARHSLLLEHSSQTGTI